MPARPVPRRAARPATLSAALAALLVALAGVSPVTAAETGTYTNPLELQVPGDGLVESCADPSVIQGQEDEGYWYLYCTMDPLNDEDRTDAGFTFRMVPQLRSTDLVHWTYVGEAFTERPAWATADAGLWAPEIEHDAATGTYILYVTVTNTTFPGGGSAIAAATSDGPTGPWTWAAEPVVEPHAPDCCPNDRRWVFDPEVIQVPEGDFIYYGSYFGGISVRELSSRPPPLGSRDPDERRDRQQVRGRRGRSPRRLVLPVRVGDRLLPRPADRVRRARGRSAEPTGPFLDRSGVDLNDDETPADPTDGRAGGSPVIVGNDDPWVGTGHNTVFEDVAGQWWTIYHAVDRNEPYFEGAVGFTKRPVLLDAIDWVDGWPTVNGGSGISTEPMPAPAAQPGDTTAHVPSTGVRDQQGARIASLSDAFGGSSLADQWSWVREPAADTWSISGGRLRIETQAADLFEGPTTPRSSSSARPQGSFIAETRVRLDVPAEGCCFNYVQAGLVLYDDDDTFVKLAVVSIWNTRQTEWAKEVPPGEPGYPRYGNSIVGPPGGFTVTEPTRLPAGRLDGPPDRAASDRR